jgi:DNA replication factor GINS
MNLDELRTVRRKERQKDSLQHLRDSFYADVARYIDQLKDERKRAFETADEPFSDPEVQRLTDEIESAEEIVESIYERRVGKTVKLASFAAADMPAETEGLTEEELDLFDDLVARIQTNRRTVLDTLAGAHEADDESEASTDATVDEAADAAAPGAGDERATAGSDDADPDPRAAEAAAFIEADTTAGTEQGADDDVLANAMGGQSEPESESTETGGSDGRRASRPESESDSDTAIDDASVDPESGDSAATERTTVRITDDVGEILAVDEREYDLEREDVIVLPTANAEPLIQNGAAERID